MAEPTYEEPESQGRRTGEADPSDPSSRESGISGQRKGSSQCLRAWAFPRDSLLRAVGSTVGLGVQAARVPRREQAEAQDEGGIVVAQE